MMVNIKCQKKVFLCSFQCLPNPKFKIMKYLSFSFFALVVFSFLSFSQLIAQKTIHVEELILENGLHVYLTEDHTKAEVFGMVIVKAGGKNDPVDATGMAHYQEHMLFKGTQKLGTTDWESEKPHIDRIFEMYDSLGSTKDEVERKMIQNRINKESLLAAEYAIPNELSNIIKGMGGTSLNAGTGPDNTVYYNSFPPNQMERWLDLYSHRFIHPVFRSFQAELEVVYEEKNMYQDMFIFPMLEKFNARFFKNHPYGQQTLIGTGEDLKNPSLSKMYDFFKTYYVANNMALILSGDFNTEQVIPIIREKFGRLRTGVIPDQKKCEETAFEGRELVEVRMSPVKLGLIGFRSAPNGHTDEIALHVCNEILSNANSTGLFDKLVLENKLMAAQIIPMIYNDYGCTIFLVVPKIIGQKIETAENMVLQELQKVTNGEFDDWMIEAAKNQLYKEYMLSLESNESKASLISDAFDLDMDVDEYLQYPEKLKQISREDIIMVANKYYGENYLAFHSRMGFPKKDKIEKPGYEALKANTNTKSIYAQEFETIPVHNQEIKFVDFDEDIQKSPFPGGDFYYTQNPKNDIFSLKIKFGVGEQELPMLKYASMLLELAGTETMTVEELKNEFGKLGSSYEVYSNDSYLIVEMDGIEKNLEESLELLGAFIASPKAEQSKIDIIIDNEKTERKMERSDADMVAEALFDFVKYGDKASGIDRLSMKEVKALKADDLIQVFKNASTYHAQVHYVGTNPNARDLIVKNIIFSNPAKESKSPVEKELKEYNENIIYFVKKKKALQSKIYFFANGKPYLKEDQPEIDAFNMYFGGGFSGLVLQEVREYRSLAYSAGAVYKSPLIAGNKTNFVGYIGTQADKTGEGLEVFYGLVRNMPQKPERMRMISDFLIQSAASKQPGFRDRSEEILHWQLKNYQHDPAIDLRAAYKNLSFEDIVSFWEENIQTTPMVIAIVGDQKSMDMNDIEKYGKIVYIKEKKLFRK